MEIVFNKNDTKIETLPDFVTMQSYTKTKDSLVVVFRSAEGIERLIKLERDSKPVYTLHPETIEWMNNKQGDRDDFTSNRQNG